MREMNKEELKNVGKEVLKYVAEVCDKYSIKYFLSFGSLIGAIRHGGYIPWDDDIDVWMLREDYNRFIEVMMNENNDDYKFISIETDKDYYFPFARVCDTRTYLKLIGMREIHGFGVYIDVFPIDNAPPEDEIERWFSEYKYLRKKVGYTVPGSAHYQEHSLRTLIRLLRRIPKRIIWSTKKFDLYRRQMQAHIQKYNDSDCEYKTVIQCLSSYGIKRALFPKEMFDETTIVSFEGVKVTTVKQYDKMLRITYGDYMQLPPVEERVSTHNFVAYWKN